VILSHILLGAETVSLDCRLPVATPYSTVSVVAELTVKIEINGSLRLFKND